MQRTVRRPRSVDASITVPGNKSIGHRAAILNAIAAGEATVRNFPDAADCAATLRCLRDLGVDWTLRNGALRIHGRGRHGLTESDRVLDCRNSGTTMRLLAGLLAPQPFFSTLSGDASLRSRPMDRVIGPLRRMGADVRGRAGDSRAPLAVRGRALRGIRYRLPVASAQVKSALLLAGLYAVGDTVVEESQPTRDHTERMLKAMGARVRTSRGVITLSPLTRDLRPLSLSVPGDVSAAAPWLVLAVCHPEARVRVRNVGVNPTRTGVLDALRLMGADVRLQRERMAGHEPVADIVARPSRLQGVEIAGDIVPLAIDELPLIALAACFAKGETVIRDAAELRVKESDRISATARELRRLGADIEELPDGMRIRPVPRLVGATVSSHGDHRLAMVLAVAGLLASGRTVIRNAGAVAVSYPLFWRDLELISSAEGR
ncbi:MAG: 3-phosphoshikimate 1-carboxyvinyltransferase [Dehalococcoidia bacterium]